ncbi:Protein CBG07143 [Caenorhabditis briggsae]|uniref:RBR-type E3 ubiquitin transferase n=1 Tax=Caenorhabditis briggsae TaxID=6238 RepID=A8X3L9_CAEBR|nr:Protein CBG07143 [Caenorhabditis briggsae]CAP27229.2 Protein CBG07143 [Caenorhabditis briggsae]
MDSQDEWDNDDDDLKQVDSDEDDSEEEKKWIIKEAVVENKILTYSEILASMQAVIKDVQSVLQQPAGICRILLQNHKWSKGQLLERFYEDPEFLTNTNMIPSDPAQKPEDGPRDCDICCENTELVGLSCNHMACRDCWKFYLAEKIKEGKSIIECMASDCKLLVYDFNEFVGDDKEMITQFEKLTVNAYVESTSSISWCPSENCSLAVKSDSNGIVECSCGTKFCSSCGSAPHDPATCRHVKIWNRKAEKEKATSSVGFSTDKDTFQWILSNTKDCPKCMTAIEKNGGCMRMSCRNQQCRFEFCWMCLRQWSVHGYSPCNTNPGIQDSRNPGFQESRNPGIQESRNPGFQESRNPGIQESRNPGIQESRNPGIQESRNPGIQESRNPGIQESRNRFSEEAEKNRLDSRAELLRFMFFYNRFKAHEQSLGLEKKLIQKIEKKMDEMQTAGMCYSETLFLRKAVDTLSDCRRTLQYTYVFAYFLERNNHAIIFENNQNDLEMATEQLSGFMEQKLDAVTDLKVLSRNVQDKARYVEHRRKVLSEHCVEGLEMENWVLNE